MPFAVRFNLARNTDVFNGWHVNQKSTRQGNMRRDPRAFLGDWLLRNLHQDLLAFIEQIGNRRLMALMTREVATAAAAIRWSSILSTAATTALAFFARLLTIAAVRTFSGLFNGAFSRRRCVDWFRLGNFRGWYLLVNFYR